MRPTALAATLTLPVLVLAQQTHSQQQNNTQPQLSTNIITSTLLSSFVTLGPDRQVSSGINTFVFTSTQIFTPAPAPTSNGTLSSNSTVSANSTTTSRNLPTAPTNVDGGGDGGAPSPGQTGVGGIYGPDDNYIAAATSLKRNAFAVSFVAIALGAVTLLL